MVRIGKQELAAEFRKVGGWAKQVTHLLEALRPVTVVVHVVQDLVVRAPHRYHTPWTTTVASCSGQLWCNENGNRAATNREVAGRTDRSADHLSSLFCSTAALDRTFCWAGVIGVAAAVVLVDVLLLAGTLVLRPTNSAMLPRSQ